jgi:hypothetical protein
MSDYVVPLTSPVQLTNIDDIHAVDLHVRYCELVKAYEQLVGARRPVRVATAGRDRVRGRQPASGPHRTTQQRPRSRRAEILLLRATRAAAH